MIIAHISDTHGNYPELKGCFDIVVHSGDFLPDLNPYRFPEVFNIEEFQTQWLFQKSKKLKGVFKDKPFLFCTGNHDFLDGEKIEKILRDNDINAFNLNDKLVEIDNFKFYGFPYIPYINGSWNNECVDDELRNKTISMFKYLKNKYLDVLVCHTPPYRILDKVYDSSMKNPHIGNVHLVNQIEHNIQSFDRPKWIMCGHVHYNCGINTEWLCNVSNAATISNNIEIL